MKYNRELKTIDTPEKAYLLGQMYGDGCNNVNKKYKFTMSSISEDTYLYYKLQVLFPFLKLKTYNNHTNMIYLENYEKTLCLDLMSLGLISNKTKYDSTGEFHFPKLQKCLIPHFIRGYFDADGSAWFPKRHRSRNQLIIEFGCSTKNFLKSIQNILIDNGIIFTWSERYKKAGNGKLYYSYTLKSTNRNTSLKFVSYIYQNASIFLQKKFDICHKEKDLRLSAYEEFGNCPHCSSSNIIRNSIRNNKQRLKCKNCFKHFILPLPK